MTPKLIPLLLVVLCAVVSCNQAPALLHEGGKTALVILPEQPERGEEIVISYNKKHAGASFKDPSVALYACVTIGTDEALYNYRLKMREVKDATGLYIVDYMIPSDAITISIDIVSYKSLITNESASTVAFAKGIPVQSALGQKIWSARSYKDGWTLFEEEARLYPHSCDRFPGLWEGRIRSGMGGPDMLAQMDSLLRELENSPALVSEQKAAGYAALASAAASMHRDAALVAYLEKLRAFMAANDGVDLNMTASRCLTAVWHELISQSGEVQVESADNVKAVELLADVLEQSRSGSLSVYFEIAMILDKPAPKGLQETFSRMTTNAESVLRSSTSEQQRAYAPLYWYLQMALNHYGRYETALKLADAGLDLFGDAPSWEAKDETQPLPYTGFGGFVNSIRFYKWKTMMAQGDVTAAVEYMDELISSKRFAEHEYYMAQTCAARAEIALNKGMKDDAARFTAYAAQFGSREADALLAKINASGPAPLSMDGLIAQYPHNGLGVKDVPHIELATDKGDIQLGAKDGVVRLLAFVSKECGVCRAYLPNLYASLSALPKQRYQLIILSEESPAEIVDHYNLNPGDEKVMLCKASMEKSMMLGVQAYPTLVLLKNGKIIERSGMGPSTALHYSEKMRALL